MARRALALLPLLLTAALFAASRRSPEASRLLFLKTTYWIMAAYALVAARGLAAWTRERPGFWERFRRENRGGMLAAAALCAVVFVSVPPRLRVLPDETVLAAVSRSMTFDKTVTVTAEAQRYFDTQYPEDVPFEIQPRPHLFPFLLSALHSVAGYRVSNAYALNFLVLWALLVLVWARERETGTGAALAAALAVAAQPVVCLSASSGGFDLLSALCVLLALAAFDAFAAAPTASGFDALWIALLAAASARYEGGVYLLVVGGSLPLLGLLKREYWENSPAFALTPLVLLPSLWQRTLSSVANLPDGQTLASPAYALSNTTAFLKAAVTPDPSLPYAGLLVLAGLGAAAWFVVRALRERDRPVLVAAAALLAHWGVVTAFYFSDPLSPSAARYYGIFAIVLGACAVRFAAPRVRPAALAGAAAALFLLYHPAAVEDRGGRSLAQPREHEEVLDFLKDKKNFLLVADKPALYTPYGFGALGFARARSQAADLKARMTTHLIEDIFVIQEIDLRTGAPLGWETLPSELPLETLFETRTRVLSAMRVSKVRRG